MTLAAAFPVTLLAALLAVGCGGASGAVGPRQDPQSAFRSIGSSRIPQPEPPRTASYVGADTTYYANGKPKSHGTYMIHRQRSVPHGLWTFWSADGNRQSQGRFHLGDPVGCFAVWTPQGDRVTGFAEKGEVSPASCAPPGHQEADMLESSYGGAVQPPVDVVLETFVAPGFGLGARSTKYVSSDPDMTGAASVMWRHRLRGGWRLGGALGMRLAEYDYSAVPATVVGGWRRQALTWLVFEVRGELGALFLFTRPQLENYAVGREYFWTPLSAVQAEASWHVSHQLELSIAARVELAMPREVERTTRVCSFVCGTEPDTWSIGGVTPGVVLGVRFLVW